MHPKALGTLIGNFKKFPGVGEKSAQRYALWLLKQTEEDVNALARSIVEARQNLGHCPICFQFSQGGQTCPICADPKRDQGVVCIIEEVKDLMAIETIGEYKGVYHILGGVISPIDGIGPAQLNIVQLQKRVINADPKITEVILAINPSVEGETTSYYLGSLLNHLTIVSQISFGISLGSELDQADPGTMERAFNHRRPLESF